MQTLNKEHFCSGTIVSKDYIITAQECTSNRNSKEILVRAGSNFKTLEGKLFRVGRIYDGYSYSSSGHFFTNYTSLLWLTKSIILTSDDIKSIEIPQKKLRYAKDSLVLLSSWGDEPTIRGAIVKISSDEKCKLENENYTTDKMICVENSQDEPDFCFGKLITWIGDSHYITIPFICSGIGM